MRRNFGSHIALTVLGTGLFLGSAWAAKVCEDFTEGFPGVDEGGMLSDADELSGELQCRQCNNTKTEKFRIKCAGTVENESGKKQKYKNSEVFGGGNVTLYNVKANGTAKFKEAGMLGG